MWRQPNLRSSALVLALAGGIEYGLQFVTPVILVRCLDVPAFAQYRLLWLLAATVLGIAPAFMPQALFYFLPRAAQEEKRLIVGNVLAYLVVAGGIVIAATSGWSLLLPRVAKDLFFQSHGLSALFLGLWVVASMLDVLPTADGRPHWQAKSTITISIFRTFLLVAAALLSGDLMWIVSALLAVTLAKLFLLLYYIYACGDGKMAWQIQSMKKQLAYSLPFALGNSLFLLRLQADQWVVASMLTPATYAIFSIAAVLTPVATLIRQPVYNAMMPHLNSAHANGNLAEIARLIAKTNGATALVLIPLTGGLFVITPELIRLVYTEVYQAAAPIMQVYLLGMMMNAFAVGHVLPALEKGRFAILNNGCCLILSVTLSVVGVNYVGPIGAAFGSVLTFSLSELWSVKIVARSVGMGMHQLLDWGALWPAVVGTFFAMAGVSIFAGNMSDNMVFILLQKFVLYSILFLSCFFLTGGRKQIALLLGQR